ncbi:MAG: gene transfer agent family protein [Mesorhizobium sp.]
MSVNRHRGEVEAVLDGRPYRLCLTLGALAELEDAYAASDLQALVARFASGKLAAGDLVRIIGAGLRGGGNEIGDEAVRAMTADGGAAGFAAIAARLLAATFGTAEGGETRP